MKKAFIYSDSFGAFSYGSAHPMRPARLKATYDLINALSLLDGPDIELVEARSATESEILTFHTPEYLKILRAADNGITPPGGPEHALGLGDNPVFKGVYTWSALGSGASIQAAELISSGRADVAFNIAGGLHHAFPDHASGFCYLNDPVLAINYLVSQGKRVAYVDIDAHHGDGVERAFFETDKVLTISIHESGRYLFPGTGFAEDIGIGEGRGYSINLPMDQYTGDALFVEGFKEIVPRFLEAFRPDVLVTQLGVDTMKSDPITHLELTTNGFEEMVRTFKETGIPWVALGGGGYDLGYVARCWTLAWAIMAEREVDDILPEKSSSLNELKLTRLRDKKDEQKAAGDIEKDIDFLLKKVLPLIKNRVG